MCKYTNCAYQEPDIPPNISQLLTPCISPPSTLHNHHLQNLPKIHPGLHLFADPQDHPQSGTHAQPDQTPSSHLEVGSIQDQDFQMWGQIGQPGSPVAAH